MYETTLLFPWEESENYQKYIKFSSNNYKKTQFVLHAGDMSYADCDESRWNTWSDIMQPLASSIPYMVAMGNHEIEPKTSYIHAPVKNISDAQFAVPYRSRFAMVHLYILYF